MNELIDIKELISLTTAGKILKKSRETVYKWIESGKLPEPVYIDGQPYLPRSETRKLAPKVKKCPLRHAQGVEPSVTAKAKKKGKSSE